MDDVQPYLNMAMEDIWRVLHILQQDNNNMRQACKRLQIGAPSTARNPRNTVNQ
jgi:hypothetical protein